MRILHTSDWHLGRSLYGRKRYDEFAAFLDWLAATLEHEKIDALLITGDVFDTSTPSNRAQELYYRFLWRVSGSCCRHIVVIAGNHDSPSFLNAPKELLRALNIHVIASLTEDPENEVLLLTDEKDLPQAIVCAVPYLRDKDIRTVEPGETIDDKNRKLVQGIKEHYARVAAIAGKKRTAIPHTSDIQDPQSQVPIIALGHLFTAGGKTVDGDGVRELYVGSLAHVDKEIFPLSIDYLALGHLHVPQPVKGADHIRYCGSPIPMGYGESGQIKKVIIVEFTGRAPMIQELAIPCFQALERIPGSLDKILKKIEELRKENSRAWLEIEYTTGSEIVGSLREVLEEALEGSSMEIRRIKNKRLTDQVIQAIQENETLDDLDVNDVFLRCLETFEVPDKDREELLLSYHEIVGELLEEDKNDE